MDYLTIALFSIPAIGLILLILVLYSDRKNAAKKSQ